MSPDILRHEMTIRLGVFIAILVIMIIAESVFPRKARALPRPRRWSSNLLLILVDSLFVRLLFPIAAVGLAIIAAEQNWGLLNLIALPKWLELALALIALDLMIYWQHVASHHIPALWALHKVHHADRDIDVTTGSRFHPIEIALSMALKMGFVLALGAPVMAVIIFEIILNGCAMFNHANVNIPKQVDRVLRRLIVTPDMHRIHHSVIPEETNSNYGFSLSLWDRIFKSYRAEPSKGHDAMIIGLDEYQHQGPASLSWSLMLPFRAIKKLERWI